MSSPTIASRVRRTGLVLGGAVVGAAALLAAAAGPAVAASRDVMVETVVVVASADGATSGEATGAANAESSSVSADLGAPLLARPQLPSFGDFELGETRFETMPSFVAGARGTRHALPGAVTMARRAAREPWLAASLTLAAPAALALPALAGVWAPAFASPLALAAGHLYAGDAGRAALVGLGGVGVAGAGAAAGFGLAGWLGMPAQGAMLLGSGVGLGAYSAWAASDAFHAAGQGALLEVVTVSPR